MDMIVRDGFDGLSMQGLARQLRISPATIYIYFKDREDLIFQLIHDARVRMHEATLKDFHPDMHFGEGLLIQWRNRFKFYLQHQLESNFMEQIKHSPYHHKYFESSDSKFAQTMTQFAKNAVERKELTRLPVEVYWSIAFAPLYQLVKYHVNGTYFPNSEKFILTDKRMMQAFDLVLKALTPENKT